MKLQIQGIKSGQTIQLLDIVNIPDGTGVIKSEMGGINEDGMYDR